MPQKTVKCSNAGCGAIYQQHVDTSVRLRVDACKLCGAYGLMDMGGGFRLGHLPTPGVARTDVWDCRMIDRTLEGSAQYNKLLVASYTMAGYEFIGFHGCGFTSACSMMRGGIDPAKNTVGARGRGFYVGSRHDGIPTIWAQKAQRKGHGVATVLAVYVKKFQTLRYGHGQDYDWGMMDGDDDVNVEGLEIVFFGDACTQLRVVPAVGNETSTLWTSCPRDSLSPEEREKVRRAAQAISVDPAQLAQWISREELGKHLKPAQIEVLESFFD